MVGLKRNAMCTVYCANACQENQLTRAADGGHTFHDRAFILFIFVEAKKVKIFPDLPARLHPPILMLFSKIRCVTVGGLI
jgi:hypothetical protein